MGESCGEDKECSSDGKCIKKMCLACFDGTKCGECNSNGDYCENQNGIGVLKTKDLINCLACTYSSTDAVANDNACPDVCEYNGCNLQKWTFQLGGNCAYSGVATYCGLDKSCSGQTSCYSSPGSCSGGGGGGTCNNNGMQDNGETGVDCGGGNCDACVACPGTCGYISAWTELCSTGCPRDYPDEKWTCVPGLPGGCGGRSGCASYDPTKGETPCSPSCGTFYVCDSQSVCTTDGCKNICTDPSFPRDGESYCSKCNSCDDTIQNCGETSVDAGGPNCGEPCTEPYTYEYVKWSPQYCRDVCAGDGATCVAVQGSDGDWYPRGCSEDWTDNCKCSKTETVFNQDSCSDEVKNCKESCVDGGTTGYFDAENIAQSCNAGTKETDNTYQPTFDFIQPSEVTGTKMYVDADSFNCADGIDNDKDCNPDCSDSDCGSALSCDCTGIEACKDWEAPETTITFDPPSPNAKGWYITKVKATLSCTDDEPSSGCSSRYRINGGQWMDYYWPFTLDDDGAFTIEYYSEDGAGNVEQPPKSATIKIYISPPLSILSKSNRVIVPLGSSGQLITNVKT